MQFKPAVKSAVAKVMVPIHKLLKVGTGIEFSDKSIMRVQRGGFWQREQPKAVKGKAAVKAAKRERVRLLKARQAEK